MADTDRQTGQRDGAEPNGEPPPPVFLELLAPTSSVVRGGERSTVQPRPAAVLAVLALRAPDPVRQEQLARAVPSLGTVGQNLHQAVARARRAVDVSHEPYRFAEEVESDVVRFRDAARAAIGEPSPESVAAALALWGEGPPRYLRDLRVVAELVRLHGDLVRLRPRVRRRRLLVVEDQIGNRLRTVFGEHECTVVDSLEAFWGMCRRWEEFDLALVDLHLQPDSVDQDGLVVVDWLARETTLPAILMTVQPAPGTTMKEVMRDYNLVNYAVKSAAFTELRSAVADALGSDVEEALLARLHDGVPRRDRASHKRLTARGASRAQVAELDGDLQRLYRVCLEGPLADARAAVRDFDEKYGDRGPRRPTAG